MSASLQPDVAIVIAVLCAGMALMSILSALADERWPVVGGMFAAISAALVAWLLLGHPGTYGLADIPSAFIRVLARVVN